MRQRTVTMKEVAAEAGVSLTTVSHYLGQRPGARVSAETRQRIDDAVEKLGYLPNLLAQSLRTKRTNTIGFVGDEIATTAFIGKVIVGAQDVATARDALVFVVSTRDEKSLENREIEELLRRRVDGIIYASSVYHRELEPPKLLASVPHVLINIAGDNLTSPRVVPDEVAGGRDAADVLISAGHRRLAFINAAQDMPAAHGRRAGFLARAAEAGIPASEIPVVSADMESAGGYQAAQQLLQLEPRPTGIFCFNDRVAMGAYHAIAEQGLRVPDDVSVVGFDNQEYIADSIYPGLTTIELPNYAMGTWAAERLFELIDSDSETTAPAPPMTLRGPVVHRDSVAPPRA